MNIRPLQIAWTDLIEVTGRLSIMLGTRVNSAISSALSMSSSSTPRFILRDIAAVKESTPEQTVSLEVQILKRFRSLLGYDHMLSMKQTDTIFGIPYI
jgi:hypothetical protein